MWFREQDCKNIVKYEWERLEGLDIVEKIRICGHILQEWWGGGVSNNSKSLSVEFYYEG